MVAREGKALADVRAHRVRERSLGYRRYQTGMWAWLLHRLSGLFLVLYLLLHIAVISTAATKTGDFTFTHTLAWLSSTPFLWLDMGLIGIVLYHAMNGIRVLIFDLGYLIDRQKEVFWVLMAIGAVLMAYAVGAILPVALGTV